MTESLWTFLRRRVRTGRGIAPHWNDERVWWLVMGPFSIRLDLRTWRFGVSVTPGDLFLTLNFGPLAFNVGRQRFRWRAQPRTTATLPGVSYQDFGCTFTFTSGSSQ